MFWLLAFGAGGYFFWTDVVDTLPGSGLVGWCLESVFCCANTTIFIRTQCQLDGQQKGRLADVKRKVATALSMKVKPVKKYRHSCAFAPISAVFSLILTFFVSKHVAIGIN